MADVHLVRKVHPVHLEFSAIRAHISSVKLRAALVAAVFAVIALAISLPAAGDQKFALTIAIDGAIGPATARHVADGLKAAAERKAELVILRLNTPGGLATSMREIIADILASPVPVIGYVAPSGGHAASAGTYILYATHVAAMAHGTNLGAATPVELGGPLPGMPGDGDGKVPKSPGADAMTAKATNDAVAFIRSLAELHNRNADWAEKAVREAASLSAGKAMEAHVIDVMAGSPAELLERIDGRTVDVQGSGPRQLASKGLAIEIYEPGWFIELLSVITDPNIAVILILIGVYGLIFEFTTPGAIAPGVIGTIALLLGLYALNLLPIDYTGLALMLLGIALLVVEAFNPTIVVGIGGAISFLLGVAMLFKVESPEYRISWTLIATTAVMLSLLIAVVGRQFWTSRQSPERAGTGAMRGLPARILDWQGRSGHVLADGERWQAEGEGTFTQGETVEVTGVDGLTLTVRRRA